MTVYVVEMNWHLGLNGATASCRFCLGTIHKRRPHQGGEGGSAHCGHAMYKIWQNCGQGGGGVENPLNFADVFYGRPLMFERASVDVPFNLRRTNGSDKFAVSECVNDHAS